MPYKQQQNKQLQAPQQMRDIKTRVAFYHPCNISLLFIIQYLFVNYKISYTKYNKLIVVYSTQAYYIEKGLLFKLNKNKKGGTMAKKGSAKNAQNSSNAQSNKATKKQQAEERKRNIILAIIIIILLLLLWWWAAAANGWWPFNKKNGADTSQEASGTSGGGETTGTDGTGSGTGTGSGSGTTGPQGPAGPAGSNGNNGSNGSNGGTTPPPAPAPSPAINFSANINNGDTKAAVDGRSSGLNRTCTVTSNTVATGKTEVCVYTEGSKIVTVTYLNDRVINVNRSGF